MKLSYIPAAIALAAALTLGACDKDGDMLTAPAPSDTTLGGSGTDIELKFDTPDGLALTIYWDDNGQITLSDPRVEVADDAVVSVVQFSATEDFASSYDDRVSGNLCLRQYTHSELSTITNRIGLPAGETSDMYVRLKSYLGTNVPATYSAPMKFRVTTYLIDMTVAKVLDASQNDTGVTLASPAADGIYSGFMGAAAWYNWWLLESNNTMWGNLGVSGNDFAAESTSNDPGTWNFWFPDASGCFFVTVDTQAKEWSALNIESLSLSGDLAGDMTYNRAANAWTYTYTAAAAGQVNITISGNAALYNRATGTAAGSGVASTAAFAGAADALTFGTTATAVTVDIPAAGETTIVLDLSNPKQWTIGTGAADVPDEPEPGPAVDFPELIYLIGITETWDFESPLPLYDTATGSYAAVRRAKSEWGYQIALEKDNWDNVLHTDDGTALSGSLTEGKEPNIPAPAEGINLFHVSLGDMTYWTRPVAADEVYYGGLNCPDGVDWTLMPMTQDPTRPTVFTAEFVKSAQTAWGVKIYIGSDWAISFGGNGTEGRLAYGGDGFTGDNDLENGATYILTVDLGECTYSYTKK